MKLYRAKNQREYDWLTNKLHNAGYAWVGTYNNNLTEYITEDAEKALLKGQLVLVIYDDKKVAWGRKYELERSHPNKPVTEVSELMNSEDHPLTKIIKERNPVVTKHKDDAMDSVRYALDTLVSDESVELVEQHERICKKLNETYAAKNHDYGNAFGESYKELGAISAVTRIYDKTNRLVSLVKKKEQKVNDESFKDTAMDLANYAIMLVMELENNE